MNSMNTALLGWLLIVVGGLSIEAKVIHEADTLLQANKKRLVGSERQMLVVALGLAYWLYGMLILPWLEWRKLKLQWALVILGFCLVLFAVKQN